MRQVLNLQMQGWGVVPSDQVLKLDRGVGRQAEQLSSLIGRLNLHSLLLPWVVPGAAGPRIGWSLAAGRRAGIESAARAIYIFRGQPARETTRRGPRGSGLPPAPFKFKLVGGGACYM